MPGTLRVAQPCGCAQETFMGQTRDKLCPCGHLYERPEVVEARTERRTSKLASTGSGASSGPKIRSGLKRGRGFAASPAQQAKVRDLPCIVCGRDRHETEIDAAHVYPRRLATCECAEGVVPLCRSCHLRHEDQNQVFDLLPALLTHGYRAELVHAIVAHSAPPVELIQQVTGRKWLPLDQHGEVAA